MNHSLVTSCEKENLKNIRNYVTVALKRYNLSENEIGMIVLAVDEVCANRMIHSNQCSIHENLEINIFQKEGGLEFEIKDKGSRFELSEYKEPSIEEIIQDKRKGGLGLILVNKIMDNVEFDFDNPFNICRLYKKVQVA